ncbi:winged helix-turn-helix domain-containing protein [Photobacterium sp. MCCC 1A19761]|uniref:winged helix-turn-helix domain-containing protein n=1 Tax=unclassified Photobacterium TaxID=2628852 RepID=UPI0021C0A6EE|nr:winged helix-turn-helix domain-containing protein [Photobacterium sp. TY1-4]UXI00024.1 winged helix-turn-helix domain-containing protein [Photobacterium sp. TY1-4]
MSISKTKTSFYRRLYIAHLIEHGIDTVPGILEYTGMPRRTAQDTIKSLADLDITCTFVQTQGERNRIGHYRISDWGAINKQWIDDNLTEIKSVLDYP